MRFYRLADTDGGPLPDHDWLKVGAVIRTARSNSPKPGAQWNAETGCWVTPIWVECDDPIEDDPMNRCDKCGTDKLPPDTAFCGGCESDHEDRERGMS